MTEWYAAHARELPWRRPGTTAWGVLVSEVMLQQTPVARVLPTYAEWMTRWPTPADLAGASAGDAVRAWGRLGYPRRALRLHAAASAIVADHGGVVPAELAALLALPGVGSYTARAVASFAFGQRHPVVDTNVRRVVARVLGGAADRAPSAGADLRAVEPLLPETGASAALFSAALMELGATVCTARAPQCGQCPMVAACRWRAAGYPPLDGPARRPQAWAGTDRQVRGRLMQLMRDAPRPLPPRALHIACDDPAQRDRALAGLLADGLVEQDPAGRYALPS
ncbi:MAG TPA: A/G-specific adenine glycosylase [Mycobacteriales bacterium]|nr:A/G-specific adenine glycosylase [Mycobacteriales bacterium]